MEIAIPSAHEEFVKQQVASGDYSCAEDVVADALGLLRARQRFESRRRILPELEELRSGQSTILEDEAALRAFFDEEKEQSHQRPQTPR